MAATWSPPPPDGRRRLAAVLAVAVVSTGLLAVAVRLGWLGADAGRGADFCEAARDGWVLQPANTLSNLGFVVAGLVIAGHRPGGMARLPGLATGYAAVVVLLGPASAAMHATQSELGGVLDLTSMYLVAGFATAYAVTRHRGRGNGFFWTLFGLLVAGCELVGATAGEVPVVLHAGNAAFGLLLVTAVAVEVLLWRRGPDRIDRRPGLAAVAVMAGAFAIWNASQHGLCDPHSLVQGHAVWHLLGAVAAYLLFRFYASERTAA